MSEEKPTEKLNECPTCGELIPEDAPQRLCPKCVLGAVAEPTDPGVATIPYPQFEPPSIEEIAAAFPQLEILELIGHGGMGAVYKARQPHLDRIVALKILPHSLAETLEFTERFSREGRLLARLSHPNIVGVFDFGVSENEGGYFFLLIEFVDGVNLRQAMRAGRFTPEQALDIAPKICEALQFAHDEGILHRDIKPENILLDTKGRVKIVDFGIAKMIGEVNSTALTRTAAPGTPLYMAPEMIEHPTEVDHRADIYSLGVVFYEMLTGELPIGRFAAPSEKSGVGPEVDKIVFRSLESEPTRRQQSADEVRTDISGVSPLTDVPRPGIGGMAPIAQGEPADSRNRPALALALTFVGVIIPIILQFGFLAMTAQARARAMVKTSSEHIVSARTSQMTYDLKEKIATATRRNDPDEKIRALKAELAVVKNQDERLRSRRENSTHGRLEFAPLLILAMIFLPLCAIPGTVFGWRQLQRQRVLGRKNGRAALIVAALFWPLIIGITIFLLIFVPVTNGLGPVRDLLLILSVIAISVWFIMRTVKWLKSPVPADERAAFLEREKNQALRPDFKNRPMLRFIVITCSILLIGLITMMIISFSISKLPATYFVVAIVILLIFAAIYFFLINRTYTPKKSTPRPNHNPWPRRVFWLIILIVIGPSILMGISLLMVKLSYSSVGSFNSIDGDYAIAVPEKIESHRARTTAVFETFRKTPGRLDVKIVFDGPEWTGPRLKPEELDVKSIYPGETMSWTLSPGFSERSRRQRKKIVFVLPDEFGGKIVFSELQLLGMKNGRPAPVFEDLKRLPLFREVKGPDGKYNAWIEFDFTPVAEATE